ncbi:MAG: VWA domain-containing protein [Legionellales bacterium]|nr:VWA domain-containing protein [Legionellales bacterium]
MNFIQSFHFIRPWWLLALIPLALLWIQLQRRYRQSNEWEKVCDPHLLPHLLVHQVGSGGRLLASLLALGWFIAVIALSGPAWNRLPQPVYNQNSSRVIVLDLSNDMLVNDVPPSRLIRARYKLTDLLKQSNEGQTALVVYSGEPYVVSPLTNDTNTISSMIADLSPAIMPVAGTNLSSALNLAAKLLKQANVAEGQIIVIMSGKADENAITKAAQLAKEGYNVSVLGVGTTKNTPIMQTNGEFFHDEQGAIVFSKLDTNSLKKLAQKGQGQYVTFSNDNSDLTALLASASTLGELQQGKEKATTDLWQDEGRWLIVLLIPLGLVAFRRGWYGGVKK